MQAALEITARYCSRELEQYGQCVAAKPESWQRDCHHLKMSIARCTSTHPIIRQIRQACAEPFEAFEECLRQNEATVGNCAEHVRRFLQCAEQVRLPPSSTTVEAKELLKMELRSDLSLYDLLMVLQYVQSSNPQASAGRLCCHQCKAEGQNQGSSPQPAEETPAWPGQVPSVATTASPDDKLLEHG